jgi:polyphosphate glucokinase
VDVHTGEILQERIRIPTPIPALPHDVANTVAKLARGFAWKEPIGCGFPSVVRNGKCLSAANIHDSWIGVNISNLFTSATNCKTVVINDADAAGLAEMRFGAGKDFSRGVVLMLTLGTGIGSAIFVDGHLLPNTEFGHIEIRGKDAEKRASDAIRQNKELSWREWGERLNEYLQTMESLIWPDVIIIGGGVSKDYPRFFPYLETQARLTPARLLNNAGIVGAALAAFEAD